MPRLTAAALVGTAGVVFALALGLPAHAHTTAAKGPTTPSAFTHKLHQPTSVKLITTLEKASKEGIRLATQPTNTRFQLMPVSGPRLKAGNKIGLLYIGAEFCPYCAGQRWGLVLTLLRFGKFTGLRYMLSSPTDVYPDTPTVTFQHSTYQSKYVAFQAVEVEDRNGQLLTALDKSQGHIFDTYDAPPYFRYSQGIPFVYVDGDYLLDGLMLGPNQLAGMNWQEIADALANPQSALFKSVMPRVNLMTAAICRLDGGHPAEVCTSAGVVAARGELPQPRSAQH